MPRGGARPGAGRPKGSKGPAVRERAAAKAYLSQRVREEIDQLATAQLELAKGAFVMFGKRGTEWERLSDPDVMLKCLQSGDEFYRIMSVRPDHAAIKDIFDREFGKPMERHELGGVDGGPVLVKFVDVV